MFQMLQTLDFFMTGKTAATFSATNLDAIYNGWVTVQPSKNNTVLAQQNIQQQE
jgi:hypothetical protein